MPKAPVKVSRGAYQADWAKNKEKKKAKAPLDLTPKPEDMPPELTAAEEKANKSNGINEVETMEPNQDIMEEVVHEEGKEEEMDLEAFSLRFVKPEVIENKIQIKDDAPAMVIKPQDAAEVIQKWCSNKPRATSLIGTNELAALIILGSYARRLPAAKIDKIASTIISGGEKVFMSQPYLNRLVKMGMVTRKQIEGSLAFSYALTPVGVTLTEALTRLNPYYDGMPGDEKQE